MDKKFNMYLNIILWRMKMQRSLDALCNHLSVTGRFVSLKMIYVVYSCNFQTFYQTEYITIVHAKLEQMFWFINDITSLLFSRSVGGIFTVSYSDRTKDNQFKLGSLWALAGAFFYAVYLVALKRKVDNEDKIDIPMFFGKFLHHFV